jgi:hypothetical protein
MDLPKRDIRRPAIIQGRANGRLPAGILSETSGLAGGPTIRLVLPAMRAWKALTTAALSAGHTLKSTALNDSYRPYKVQKRLFLERYSTTDTGGERKVWQGKSFFLKDGEAAAATPGSSNHGWGLAVDTGEESDHDLFANTFDNQTLKWLVNNEERFGFSHERQDEPWHIRYFAGDNIPAAVLAFEQSTGRGPDMPLTEDDAEQVATATWIRDTDPKDNVKEVAWIALHNARRDAAAALKQISLLRTEFAAFNNRDLVDEQAIINGLLAALSPTQIADAIIEALPPHQATEIADGILGRLNPDEPDTDD